MIAFAGCAIADEPPTEVRERAANAPHANQLARETSPYLLQHAHNPVDWHPWGEAAFALARESNRPVFLSIGYSSCHWCHVMERESFMDDEIAAFLNEHFVCIKVDREERPDVDEIYMTALQLMGGRGGWPLTVFLTADGKPFFGGTYWPPRDRRVEVDGEEVQATGLLTILAAVADAWSMRHDELTAAAGRVTAAVELTLRRRSLAASEPLSAAWIDDVQAALGDTFDPAYGGFGYSEATPNLPKFPEPTNLLFLLDRVRRSQDAEARKMLVATLDRLAAGGIRDHLGGGFHRYSTDRYWRVPHFEKMLYDNALLLSVYARAYAALGRDEYRDVATEIVAFLVRELRAPEGGLYSAIDADSQGAEGAFYVWDAAEIRRRLSPDELAAFAPVFVADEPNFEGHWILENQIAGAHAAERLDADGQSLGPPNPPPDAESNRLLLASAKAKLLAARGERTRPATDTKILCAWNGLAIRGLADAARLANIEGAADAARDCARFVLAHHKTANGRLMRSHAAGQSRLNAYLDDYAFLVDGLIALHEASGEQQWLSAADELTARQIDLFWDTAPGGFYYTSSDHPSLIARSKDPADSATPSANAVSAANLVYIADALGKREYRDRAEQTIQAFASLARQAPNAMPTMAIALSRLIGSESLQPSVKPQIETQK